MIYLDYSTTTKMSYEVLDAFNKVEKESYGLISSNNKLGESAKELYKRSVKEIADLFSVMESEITFTSGATEANNLALIGTLLASHKSGNHIIVSKLEHQSIYKICNYLEKLGFEIDYVKNDNEGLIDFEDLKRLIRPDTILVSICNVNESTGVRQPLKMIRQIIKKENPNTLLHSDMSQAVGKISINLHDVDLASISSHKIFGPKGIGMLYHSEKVKILPLLFGESNDLNPNTLSLASVVALKTALMMANQDLDKRDHFVTRLNEKICNELSKYNNLVINKTKYSIPYIINISIKGVDLKLLNKMLSDRDVFVKYLSDDKSVISIYEDDLRGKETIRICLCHKTTTEDVNTFLSEFKKAYQTVSLGE